MEDFLILLLQALGEFILELFAWGPWDWFWYWGDWRKDARLRRCSYAARGLWADMLSLMGGETDHVGCLVMEGQALDASDLAGLLGGGDAVAARSTAE